MRAAVIRQFGNPDGIEVIEMPSPAAGTRQVVIAAEAIGVGGVDAVIRRGTLGGYGFEAGHVLGSEVAGTVISVGPDVEPRWLGRRVWAHTGTGGAYADQAVADLADVVALPDGLPSVDAVTLGSAAPVAHFAIAHAHFARGDRVLVRGAAGSLGIATVELARSGGAGAVAVTTSSHERGDRLRQLGASHVTDRNGRGDDPDEHYDVIVDVVGGAALPDIIDLLAPNGRLVLVGVVAGLPPSDFGMRLLAAFQSSRSVATFSLDSVRAADRDAVRLQHFTAAARGELHAVVHAVLPLAAAADAHRQMDEGTVFGRIVLTP